MSFDQATTQRSVRRGNALMPWVSGFVIAVMLICCGGLGYVGYLIVRPEPPLPPLVFNTSTPPLDLLTPQTTPLPNPTPAISSFDFPTGKIVFACMFDMARQLSQICLINADGSGFEQLTDNVHANHYYPSLAPDGKSVVFVSNQTGRYEIFESDFEGRQKQLTYNLGETAAPEISPDGSWIVFTLIDAEKHNAIWVMASDGNGAHQIYGQPEGDGWDPTWSPDGQQILFASRVNQIVQLFIINVDGTNMHQVTDMNNLRGRSDWSVRGDIVTYSGTPWTRELYLMKADGSDSRQITPTGGNSQGPSFSPDGEWVAFTAYFDHPGDISGCEIYIMRVDGTRLMRLTDNNYCDWQPRWGP
jgi:TolB protein